MAEYNPEMAPTYTGEQPGSIRKFLGELLGIDPGVDRYEDVFAEGVPSYDIASGDVRPIGRRAIRYGDAPPMPLDLEEDTAQFDPNVMPTGEEMTEEQFMAGQPATGKFSDIPEPGIKPQYRGDGRESIRDANTRLAATQDVGYQVPNAPMNLTGEDAGPDAASSLLQNIPPDADSLDNRFIGTGLGGWKPSIPADNTPGSMIQDGTSANVPSVEADSQVSPTNPGCRVIPGKWAGVPKRSPYSHRYYTGDDMGDLVDIDPGSLNPPGGGMDITGEASLPPGVMNQLDQMISTPVPPPTADQIALAQGGGGPSVSGAAPEITPTPLPMNPPVGQGMEGPDAQAMSINQPVGQGMGAGPNAQAMSINPPTLPDAPISNVRPPTIPLNQPPIVPPPPAGPSVRTGGPGGAAGMAGGIDAQQGGFNLMNTIMGLLPSSSPEVATNTPRFQGASIPSPQSNAIPQILQDFQSRYGPKR